MENVTSLMAPLSGKGLVPAQLASSERKPLIVCIGFDLFIECTPAQCLEIVSRRLSRIDHSCARLLEAKALIADSAPPVVHPASAASSFPHSGDLSPAGATRKQGSLMHTAFDSGLRSVDHDDDDDDADDEEPILDIREAFVEGDSLVPPSSDASPQKKKRSHASESSTDTRSSPLTQSSFASMSARLDELERLDELQREEARSRHAAAFARVDAMREERDKADLARKRAAATSSSSKLKLPSSSSSTLSAPHPSSSSRSTTLAGSPAAVGGDVIERVGQSRPVTYSSKRKSRSGNDPQQQSSSSAPSPSSSASGKPRRQSQFAQQMAAMKIPKKREPQAEQDRLRQQQQDHHRRLKERAVSGQRAPSSMEREMLSKLKK